MILFQSIFYILHLFHKKFNKKNKLVIKRTALPKKKLPITLKTITDKYLSLLFDIIQNKKCDWDKWFKIAGILKNNGYPFSIFKEYSDKMYPNSAESEKTWNSISNISSMSIYGLQNIAKEEDPIAYKKWLIEHNNCLTANILKKGENHVAQYISNYLKDEFVFTKTEWWLCNHTTHLWCVVEEPSARITTKIQK